jgi:hypothetical protein
VSDEQLRPASLRPACPPSTSRCGEGLSAYSIWLSELSPPQEGWFRPAVASLAYTYLLLRCNLLINADVIKRTGRSSSSTTCHWQLLR